VRNTVNVSNCSTGPVVSCVTAVTQNDNSCPEKRLFGFFRIADCICFNCTAILISGICSNHLAEDLNDEIRRVTATASSLVENGLAGNLSHLQEFITSIHGSLLPGLSRTWRPARWTDFWKLRSTSPNPSRWFPATRSRRSANPAISVLF